MGAAMRAGGNRDVTVRVFPQLNHLFVVSPTDGSPAEYAALFRPTITQHCSPLNPLDSLIDSSGHSPIINFRYSYSPVFVKVGVAIKSIFLG